MPGRISGATPESTNIGTIGPGDNAIGRVKITDGADVALVSAAGELSVTGPVTNTGTFAVQDATAQASLSVLDDWDESDRAKVSPIVGSAGVAGGAGAVTATVQRYVEAGHTPWKSLDLDETEEEIKDTGGTLVSFAAFNTTAAILWLKFYDADADDVTVGTTVPVLTLGIPGNNDTDGGGLAMRGPWLFATAIVAACTTGFADNDSGAPAANALILNVAYD